MRAPVDREAAADMPEHDALIPSLPILAPAEGTLEAGASAPQEREYRPSGTHGSRRRAFDCGQRNHEMAGAAGAATTDATRAAVCDRRPRRREHICRQPSQRRRGRCSSSCAAGMCRRRAVASAERVLVATHAAPLTNESADIASSLPPHPGAMAQMRSWRRAKLLSTPRLPAAPDTATGRRTSPDRGPVPRAASW